MRAVMCEVIEQFQNIKQTEFWVNKNSKNTEIRTQDLRAISFPDGIHKFKCHTMCAWNLNV